MIYDSEPDGPHARHRGDVTRLLAAVDTRLDQLGVSPRPTPKRFAHDDVAADAVLHRAGFVPAVEFGGEHYHRLPSAMTDPDERRLVVTRAFDMLQADGFDVSCDPDLLEHDMPPPGSRRRASATASGFWPNTSRRRSIRATWSPT